MPVKEKEQATQVKEKRSVLRKIIKVICIILAVILGGGVLFLISWAMPWSYSSEIKGYSSIEGACASTTDMYFDDLGRLNFVKSDNRDFIVMDITDVHLGCSPYTISEDKQALESIHKLADSVKPDLIIATGDCIYSAPTMGSLCSGHSERVFAKFMETLGIPWTIAFGNHESEVYAFAGREKMGEILENEKYKNCVFTSGPKDITGVGNQVIIVRNNDDRKSVNQVLIPIDSNDYTKTISCYDSIHPDQIEWYNRQITQIAEEEGKTPREISSLAFFHIPVTEYETADGEGTIHFGQKNEPVCHPADKDSDIFFEEMREFGSTRAMFAGHDHTNNYCVEYKGILLTYSLSIDWNSYKDIEYTDEYRGATVISIGNGNHFKIDQCHYGDIK